MTNQYLSPTELQMLDMLNCGYTNQEIARELHYDNGSVCNIFSRIADRLGLDHDNRRDELKVYYSSLVQY